jgi:hypothetical protein
MDSLEKQILRDLKIIEQLIEKVAKGELDAEMAANLVVGTEEELAPYVSQRVFEVKEGMKYLGDFSPNIKHERKPFLKIEFVAKEVKDKSFKYEITEGGVNVLKAIYGLTDDQIKGIREGSVKPGSDVWNGLMTRQWTTTLLGGSLLLVFPKQLRNVGESVEKGF